MVVVAWAAAAGAVGARAAAARAAAAKVVELVAARVVAVRAADAADVAEGRVGGKAAGGTAGETAGEKAVGPTEVVREVEAKAVEGTVEGTVEVGLVAVKVVGSEVGMVEVEMAGEKVAGSEVAKVFFSVYRAMPINEQGPALARGEPSITLDGVGGLLHLQEGRFAADAALIPPTSLIGVEARAGLVDIYCRYRRQYARGPHRAPAAFESMDMDEEGPSPTGVRGGIDPAPLTAG